MEKFVNAVCRTFTTWLLTAIINGVLITTWCVVTCTHSSEALIVGIGSIIFTLGLSIPGFFVFWIIFIVKYNKADLFQILLRTTVFVAVISTVAFFSITGGIEDFNSKWLGSLTVLSTMLSLFIHHNAIRNIAYYNQRSHQSIDKRHTTSIIH